METARKNEMRRKELAAKKTTKGIGAMKLTTNKKIEDLLD
jgi:hypothetical protein